MYAVVEAGGRQYQLTSGRFVDVDMVAGEPQSEFVFDRVLMIVDGDKSTVGKPIVDGAKVTGKIISHGQGPKLIVYKYRAKKGTRKRTGHRQGFTRIYIDSIKLNDKVLSEVKDEGRKTAPKTTKSVDTEKAAKREAEKQDEKARASTAKKAAAPKKAEAKAEPKKTTKKKEQ
jgi:large subunit ribosomal protein L21